MGHGGRDPNTGCQISDQVLERGSPRHEVENDDLLNALTEGDVNTARKLIDKLSLNNICTALYESNLFDAMCFLSSAIEDHLSHVNSPQHLFSVKPRVVALADVAEKCGPIYGPFCTFSFGDRPIGWGAAAAENRVFSWMEFGVGLVGDQIVNIDDRYITALPLDEFEGVLIAGPLDSVERINLSAEEQVVTWKGQPLTMDPFDPAVFREVFSESMRRHAQLEWSYDFRANAAAREAFLFYYGHDQADEHADILLAKAAISADEESCEQLKRAVELDPSIKYWADWVEAYIYFPDNMSRIVELKDMDAMGSAVFTACQTFVDLEAGKDVSLEPLEAFVDLHYDSKSPYMGYLLAQLTEKCLDEALDRKDSIEDGGDPVPYEQALRLGFRGRQAIGWLMQAIKAKHNDFVRICLNLGFKPVGRFVSGGYLNLLPLAASSKNLEAVKAALEYGADANEPSHYDGLSALALGEQQAECGEPWPEEIMELLRANR